MSLAERVKRGFGFPGGGLMMAVLWLLLWIIPWGQFPAVTSGPGVALLADLVRLIAAMGLFLVPGVLLYLLLHDPDSPLADSLGFIPIGFTLSVLVIGFLGLIGRMTHTSFRAAAALFCLFGLIEILVLSRQRGVGAGLRERIFELLRTLTTNLPLVSAILLGVLMGLRGDLFFIDDATYLAYLTSWQHSASLGFGNLIYGTNVTEAPRFWLALYPMGQALLSALSGVPGLLLLSNYLELLLVPVAIVAAYWLARSLGLGRRMAGLAVLIQVTFYAWMQGDQWPPGMWFFQNMAEDKVTAAFILAPVFFVFTLHYLKTPSWRNLLLVLIAGLSLTLTHPILLFFACLVAGCMALIGCIAARSGWRRVIGLLMICIACLAPYAFIVYGGGEQQAQSALDSRTGDASYELSRYVRLGGGIFYGLNPQVLELFDFAPSAAPNMAVGAFRALPILLMIAAGGVCLLWIRSGVAIWFTLSSIILVAFAAIPYTGWILGYFVSPRLIVRASWYMPLGLASVLLMQFAWEKLRLRALLERLGARHLAHEPLRAYAVTLVCLAFASPALAWAVPPGIPLFIRTLGHSRELAAIGAYIDSHSSPFVTAIALDYGDNLRLPGIAANVRLVSFREELDYDGSNFVFSLEQIQERKQASAVIRSLQPPTEGKDTCALLRQFKVVYVIAPNQLVQPFEAAAEECRADIEVVYSTANLQLLQFQGEAPAGLDGGISRPALAAR